MKNLDWKKIKEINNYFIKEVNQNECKCKFYGRKCNLNQKSNNDKHWCECKKHHVCKKDYILNSATCSCENSKYLASTIDDSVITCDEFIKQQLQKILMKKI